MYCCLFRLDCVCYWWWCIFDGCVLVVFAIDGGVFLTVVSWLCLLLIVVYFWRLCFGCVCYWLWCIVDCCVLAVFAIECGVLLTVVSWLCLLLSVVCLPPRASLFAFLHVIWWLIVDRFYIALFSALSSRLTALACDSTRVNTPLQRVFEYPPEWCT